MRIPESTIAQINDKADLVAIIRRHTELKPAGREFRGCCPFHGEKTPSFYVNPESNLYYCFGCGAKGNPISFLVDFERLTFIEAVKELADKTGIDLPKEDNANISYKRKSTSHTNTNPAWQKPAAHTPKPQANSQIESTKPNANTPVANTARQSNDNLASHDNGNVNVNVNVNTNVNTHANNSEYFEAVQDFDTAYHEAPTPTNFDGSYLKPYFEPHIEPYHTPDYVHTFDTAFDEGLNDAQGNLYALLKAVNAFYQAMLQEHSAAMQYFVKRGITPESIAYFELGYAPMGWQHLEAAFPNDIEGLKILGLVRPSQKGRDYDLFRDRVIFPIKDKQGRIVGFAGRAMSDDVMPKYINSSDSVVFQKQHILYGYYESRQAKAQDWLMVEGYMDVIALHQAGIFGAVAPMGTAANQGQIESLLKFNNELTLCFDGDKAGQKAALRALEVAMPVLPDGKTLKFLTLRDNHDPDSFIKAYGVQKMREAMAEAVSISDYLYRVLSAKYELTKPEQKAAAMAELKGITAHLPKGSSFRSLLNSDMYARLSARRATHVATPVADSKITALEELYLCILYAPNLLQDNAQEDVLERLYQQSGVMTADLAFAHHLQRRNLVAPALPTWQDIDDDLATLVATAKQSLPYLLAVQDNSSAQTIDANAHFILAALNNGEIQARLANLWRDFFHHLQRHNIDNASLLFDELLCSVLMDCFVQAQKNSDNLLVTKIYHAREITLSNWDKRTTKAQIQRMFESGNGG